MNKQNVGIDTKMAIKILKGKQPHVMDSDYYYKKAVGLAISALEKQLTNGWIPVSERLPENEERVLICADRKRYDGKAWQIRTIAMYEDGTMHTEDSGFVWEDNDFEYCEETDDYIIPEGWWEQNMYSEEFGMVDDFVTHWMPLPEKSKEVS